MESPNVTTVKWNGEVHSLSEPAVVESVDQCIANLHAKLVNRINPGEPANPAEASMRQNLVGLLEEFIRAQYSHADMRDVWEWKPRSLVNDTPGIYGMVYPGGSIKFGMAFHRKTRTGRQSGSFAALILDLADMEKLVSEEVVAAITSLGLPSLVFYKDKVAHRKTLIRMQVCEMFLACSRSCATNTVCERLMQLPSDAVRQAVQQLKFPPNAIEFMSDIPDGGVFCVFTWPTLPSYLQQLAKTSPDFLPHRLRAEPPKGGFVKANRAIELLGPKFGGWEDSVKFCPRAVDLDVVVENVSPLLDGTVNATTVETNEAIRSRLDCIRGENYKSYVRPSQASLANGARQVLTQAFQTLPTKHVIMVEKSTIEALEVQHGDWLESVIDTSQGIEVLQFRAIFLVRATSGHRVIITLSFFVAFSDEATLAHRFNCTSAFVVLMDLLRASGNRSLEAFSTQRDILQAFLMRLVGDDDEYSKHHFSKARENVFPDGYFLGNARNVQLVSQGLGIGYAELLYLRERLGPVKTNKLLIGHGLLLGGQQPSSPLEPDWFCTGIPACAGLEASPCTVVVGEGELPPYAVMAGTNDSEHPLYGLYACARCHRKLPRYELAHLRQLASDETNEMRVEQQERKEDLDKRVVAHRKRDQVARQNNPEGGKKKRRKHQAHQHQQFSADHVAHRAYLDKKKEQAKGCKPKATGTHRESRSKKLYPPFFMDILTNGLGLYAQESGQEFLYWNDIVAFCDVLLTKESNNIDAAGHKPKVRFEDGQPYMYLAHAYKVAADPVLQQDTNQRKMWRVLDYNSDSANEKIAAAAKMDSVENGFINHVVDILYKVKPVPIPAGTENQDPQQRQSESEDGQQD